MKSHGRNGHEDIVGEAVQAMNGCPVPDQIKGLDWSLLVQKLDRDTDRDTRGAVPSSSTNIWRTIMNKRLVKLGVAAALVVGVAALLWPIVENGGSSVAYAEVVRQMSEAQTLTWTRVTQIEGGEPLVSQHMYMAPGRLRISSDRNISPAPLPEATIWIVDYRKGEMLFLDSKKRIATKVAWGTGGPGPDLIEEMKSFRSGSEKSLGAKEIDGRKVAGFLVHKHGLDLTVWADPQTGLPIRIETEGTDRKGRKTKVTYKDMKFNVKLDESLFSLTPPSGYAIAPISQEFERILQEDLRSDSAAHLHILSRTCLKYAKDHNGQWPDSLQQLLEHGIKEKSLVNPARPQMKPAYIYIRPTTAALATDQLLIYEAHDEWKDGINVVLGPNGHVKFISDESAFKKLLEKAGDR